jgi:hypothetical protein
MKYLIIIASIMWGVFFYTQSSAKAEGQKGQNGWNKHWIVIQMAATPYGEKKSDTTFGIDGSFNDEYMEIDYHPNTSEISDIEIEKQVQQLSIEISKAFFAILPDILDNIATQMRLEADRKGDHQ